jgi:hypothetical protein
MYCLTLEAKTRNFHNLSASHELVSFAFCISQRFASIAYLGGCAPSISCPRIRPIDVERACITSNNSVYLSHLFLRLFRALLSLLFRVHMVVAWMKVFGLLSDHVAVAFHNG